MKNQYKYIDDLPSLSEAEIAKHKDFKAILDKRTNYLQRKLDLKKKLWKGGISIVILGAISAALFLWDKPSPNMEKAVAIEIEPTRNAITNIESFEIEFPKAKSTEEVSQTLNPIPPISSDKGYSNQEERILEEERKDKPNFQMGYEKAIPIVGLDSLSKYLNKNLQYPEEVDKSDGIEGSVNVLFSITKEGKPLNIEVQNSLGEAFDRECIRLIANMPEWRPAIRNGEPEDSKVSIRISFTIAE